MTPIPATAQERARQMEALAETTDDADAITVLAEVARCAGSWEPEAQLLGNVRAGDIVRAISAALPALRQAAEAARAVPVAHAATVKPLVWQEPHPSHKFPMWVCSRRGVGAFYVIRTDGAKANGDFALYYNERHIVACSSLEAAKAAAQADYTARILSTLDPALPVPASAGVADGLEMAVVAGWNACRRSIYAVCEDVDAEYEKHRADVENSPRHHFGRGGMTAAKSIARGFNSMEALDDDNVTAAIRSLAGDTSHG